MRSRVGAIVHESRSCLIHGGALGGILIQRHVLTGRPPSACMAFFDHGTMKAPGRVNATHLNYPVHGIGSQPLRDTGVKSELA
jgi:hypothetical protein